jgi:quercetin dioxygenase-like cupin family protein
MQLRSRKPASATASSLWRRARREVSLLVADLAALFGPVRELIGIHRSVLMSKPGSINPGEALRLVDLIVPAPHGIASRVLAKTGGGNVTLFAFDAGEGLSEHTAPFDALVLVLDGLLTLTIGGNAIDAAPGIIARMPAHVPHAVDAREPSRMLLIMLREPSGGVS